MAESRETLLTHLGLRFGISGPHAARTMMLDDLRVLLAHVPAQADRDAYAHAIVEDNVLAKPTRKSRELALRHLGVLYALDLANPLFRALRTLWHRNESAQPILALAVALARDPLLRSTQSYVVNQAIGTPMPRETLERFLSGAFPDRFSPASLRSTAQNVGGTWTSAGLLQGHRHKIRSQPVAQPESVAMLLFLGYLEGRTGQRLFSSDWLSIFGIPGNEVEMLASAASNRGLLVFMNAGGVQEVRFPGYLTPDEELIRQEVSHVV